MGEGESNEKDIAVFLKTVGLNWLILQQKNICPCSRCIWKMAVFFFGGVLLEHDCFSG